MRHVKGNWYGIPKIKFYYHNEWSDPEIEYKGKLFNVRDVEDDMYMDFTDENPNGTEAEFADYMFNNADIIYGALDDLIYFKIYK